MADITQWAEATDAYESPERANSVIEELVDEIERLRAQIEQLTSRSCRTCAHGKWNPKYDPSESGVACEQLNIVFRHDYYCSKWEPNYE